MGGTGWGARFQPPGAFIQSLQLIKLLFGSIKEINHVISVASCGALELFSLKSSYQLLCVKGSSCYEQ